MSSLKYFFLITRHKYLIYAFKTYRNENQSLTSNTIKKIRNKDIHKLKSIPNF